LAMRIFLRQGAQKRKRNDYRLITGTKNEGFMGGSPS
jgi:hypothetical protein